MDKRASKKKEHDFSVTAFRIVQEATAQAEEAQPEPKQTETQEIEGKNPHAVALGRLGGKKGGPASAKKLTLEERQKIARNAAKKRWQQHQDGG